MSQCFYGSFRIVAPLHAQGELEAIESLYNAADYDRALALLDKLEPVLSVGRARAAELRILCLLALGHSEPAELAIETLIERVPRFQPDPNLFSPTRREFVEAVRRRILPRIIETKYAQARATFEAKDYENARERVDVLLDLLNDTPDHPRSTDARTLASRVVEMARHTALPNAVGTSGSAADKPLAFPPHRSEANSTADSGRSSVMSKDLPRANEPTIYDSLATDVVPPAPLNPLLPRASLPASILAPQSGLFEVVVDESGRVESVLVRRSIHPQYDASVMNESRTWRFKPATRGGQPVKFRKLIEIYAAPFASIRQ